MSDGKLKIGIIGGAGNQGAGLAARWSLAGHHVVIGSRDETRARETAARIAEQWQLTTLQGGSNVAAATQDLVVVSVPFGAKEQTFHEVGHLLAGKIVIDLTVPLVPPKVSRVQLPRQGSGSRATRHLLPETTRLVAAFQNVSAEHLADREHQVECDVMVCSDDAEARALVVALASDAGLRGIEAGPLDNAAAADALTSVLIWINRNYRAKGAGIRITGVDL